MGANHGDAGAVCGVEGVFDAEVRRVVDTADVLVEAEPVDVRAARAEPLSVDLEMRGVARDEAGVLVRPLAWYGAGRHMSGEREHRSEKDSREDRCT